MNALMPAPQNTPIQDADPYFFPKIYDFNNRQDYGKEGPDSSSVPQRLS